jgi:hypothetical protein
LQPKKEPKAMKFSCVCIYIFFKKKGNALELCFSSKKYSSLVNKQSKQADKFQLYNIPQY